MAGRVQWEAQVDSNVAKLLSETKELRDQLDGIKKGNYEIKLNIDDKKLEKVISNLDKMLESLGKGTGDFKEFENLSKQLNKIVSEVKEMHTAFGGINDSGVSNLLSSIQSIDKSLSSLSERIISVNKDFGSVGKNASDNVGQINEVKKVTEGLTEATKELANAQKNVGNKSNISSPIKDTFQGDAKSSAESSAPAIKEEAKAMEQVAENAEKASKGKEKFAKANKNVKASADASTGSIEKENSALDEKVWEKNLKVIQEYMDANTKLNKLNAKDKGTGKHASDIARQEKEVEKLRESALEARTVLSSMINPHDVPIEDWNKWIEAMEKFEQATKGSAESVAKLEDALRSARNAQLSSIDSTINNSQSKLDNFSARKAQSDAYKNSLIELGETLERLRTLRASLSNTRAFTDEEQTQIQDLTKSVHEYINAIKNMPAGEKGSDEGSRTKWANRIKEYMEKNTRLTREFREELENLIKILRTGGDSVNIKNIIGQFEDAKFRIKEAKLEGKSFFDIFKDKAVYGFAAKLANYYLSFYDFIRYGRYAVDALIELDSALLDLKKTTAMTENQLEDFYYASNDVAKQMGVTTAEIIEQASAWSRLGYSSESAATKMAQLSSQFASISPGMETDQAQEGLVSIMKAWDIDPDEVESEIMDNINILGNSFAESNADVVEGMKRSAAALSAVGTEYKDAFALFTGAQEILQNAEVTGRALRSISMRVRGYSESSEDGFEELDDELKNITGDLIDLTKTAEHSQGVSIFKEGSTTEFKSLVEYFGEISEIWDEMTQKQQNDFLQKAFGKTQAQAGAALIQNFEAVRDSLEVMENSAGSADREMSIVQETLEYKINALKQTWVGTVQEMIDRGDLGVIIDGLVKLSEAIGFVLDKAGLLGTAGLIGGGILSVKNAGICV